MKVTFERNQLQELLNDFYNCTHMAITLFDSELECIYGRGDFVRFCDHFAGDPTRVTYCDLSNKIHAAQAKKEKRTIVFTCHAGMTETITPIFYDDVIIAYLMLGRFRDQDQLFSSEEKMLECIKKFNFSSKMIKKLIEDYNDATIISQNTIYSAINILEIAIKYIWSESLIKLNKNMLAAQIEDYIVNNLNEEISIISLCRHFGVSKQNLYSVFKDEFNDTIKNYIIKKRIEEAKKLLKTDAKIYEIATNVGFEDYNYFIRLFKKITGRTPFQYRKEKQEKENNLIIKEKVNC